MLAGWDTQQMLGGIEPILHLAEAGALDLGRASDLVTDSMSALGVEVGDLDGYLDKVAKTSASANTDIDALMEAFVIAGGTFKQFNVPLEEANSFLGVMANRGFKGAEAGTAINAIMTRLTSSTGPAADALKELGVNAFDNKGNFRGMETVMKDVEKKLSTMTDKQRAHYQSQIAGLNHGKSFNAMLSGLGDEYDDLKAGIVDSNGALLEMRNIMKDNLQGALENLSSAFEEIMISIGYALLPFVKQLVGAIQSLADWFNNLSDSTKEKIALFAALSAIILVVGGGLLLLIGFLPNIISGFQAVTTVIQAVSGAFTTASLPILGFVILIAGVVAAIIHLWRTNEDFRNNILTIWENIKTIIVAVWEAVKPGALIFIQILGVLMEAITMLIGWVAGIVASISNWIVAFIEANSWIITTIQVLGIIAGVIAGIIAIVGVVIAIFTVLATIVKVVAAVFLFFTSPLGIIIAVVGAVVGAIMWLAEKFEWIGNVVDKVTGFISGLWDGFLGLFGKGTQEASGLASTSLIDTAEAGKEALGDLSESGTESMEELNEGVTSNTAEMSDMSVDDINRMRAEGMADLESLNIEGVGNIEDMTSNITGDIGDMANISLDDIASLETGGVDAFANLDKGVTTNVSDMTADVKKEVGSMETVASGDFSGLSNDMTANAKKVSEDVGNAFKGMSKSIKSEMDNIKKSASDGMKNIGKTMADGMKSSLTLIKSSMTQISAGFKSGFSDITRSVIAGFTLINARTKVETTKFSNTIKTSNKAVHRDYVSAFRSINQAVRSGMNSAYASVRSSNAKIIASTRTLNGSLRSAGVYAMSGLRSGLNAGAGSVYASARSIANRVANTIRAALKVKSPSRVMMDIGKWVALGMANGISRYTSNVEKSANLMAEAATPDVDLSYMTPRGLSSTVASSVNGDFNVGGRDNAIIGELSAMRNEMSRQRQIIVEMEGRVVGEIVEPFVTEKQGFKTEFRRRNTGGGYKY